ncbi:MAG: hypothetical protein ACRDNB_00665 [Gaiellaceae bacterium]
MQFTAAVTGAGSTAVTWSAEGGSINASGLYTAGNTAGVFAVTATSVADPTASGTAFVQITVAAVVTGLYVGERCIFFEGEQISCGQAWMHYVCGRESFVGAGLVCGWSTTFNPIVGFGRINVPTLIRFCEVETTGSASGGSFTGRITFCHPPPLSLVPASAYSGVSISGSVGDGRLRMEVRDAGAGLEVYDLTRAD